MKKFVDVQANYPVSGVTGFVRGRLNNVEMSVEDIFKCLCCRATVIENIGGRKIKLTLKNYNKNNALEVKPVAVVAEKAPANVEPVQNPEPEKIAEETPVENAPVPVAAATEETPTTAADEETAESESTETTDDTAEVSTDDEETVSENDAAETENSSESTDSETIPANVNVPRNKKHRR